VRRARHFKNLHHFSGEGFLVSPEKTRFSGIRSRFSLFFRVFSVLFQKSSPERW